MNKKNTPLERLRHHVTGAIERGEKQAIEAVVSRQSHTPGPWEIRSTNINGHVISDIINPRQESYIAEKVQGEANAHLIAAAPEMLEALERAREYLSFLTDDHPEDSSIQETLKEADAAIAKARGDK